VAVGGGSRSDYWLQVIATALDHPLSIPEAGDFGAAFGAARLGMMAATGDPSIATPPRITRTVAPDAGLAAAFDDGHARYKRAAQAILELT
jgi:xylulokinase